MQHTSKPDKFMCHFQTYVSQVPRTPGPKPLGYVPYGFYQRGQNIRSTIIYPSKLRCEV
jgi:hypothetical protein